MLLALWVIGLFVLDLIVAGTIYVFCSRIGKRRAHARAVDALRLGGGS